MHHENTKGKWFERKGGDVLGNDGKKHQGKYQNQTGSNTGGSLGIAESGQRHDAGGHPGQTEKQGLQRLHGRERQLHEITLPGWLWTRSCPE